MRAEGQRYADQMRAAQHDIVQAALRATDGNRSQAARQLGLTRSALQRMLRRLPVAPPPGRIGRPRRSGGA